MKTNLLLPLFFFALFVVFFPVDASAQAARGPDPLVVSVSPEAPAPGDLTTIALTSTPIDLGQAQFVWKINSTAVSAGIGKRSFSFTMGGSQTSTVISVNITAANGNVVDRTFTFHPGSVTLLWEAHTYTPPFYRGKSLYTPGADVRVVAVPSISEPNGTPIPASQLVYQWSVDDRPFADRSGLGRSTFYLSGSQLISGQTVAVDVIRSNRIKAAHAELVIPKSEPVVRFYKSDPLRGVLYNQAYIGAVRLADTETTLLAEPYFISGTVREPSLVIYTWNLNNSEIEPRGAQRSLITLRQNAGQSGSAKLSLRIQNGDLRRLLQQASEELTLVFGN